MGATEETVKDALAKGTKSISLKGLLSDGIGNLVGGVTSLGGGLAAVLASVAGVAIPALLAGVAVYAGKSLWDNVLPNNNANKKYEKSSQKYDNAVSERDSLQSEYDSNKERYYELNAKENRSTDEQAELENLASKNSLMESQLKVKDNLVDATQKQQALDAKDALEKSGLHTNKKRDFSACSNASLICSLASARRYLFTPSRIKSTLVPVAGIPPCKALLYVSVLMCGSFRKTRLMP